MNPHIVQWIWYIAGILITLAWKWQRYCYESKGRGIPFWKASREWFELETVGSKVSWGATWGGAWLIGTVLITREGADWLFGGLLANAPNIPPMIFFVGAVQEMIVPAVMKWIVGRLAA